MRNRGHSYNREQLKKMEIVKRKLNVFLSDGREREEEKELQNFKTLNHGSSKHAKFISIMPMLFLKPEG